MPKKIRASFALALLASLLLHFSLLTLFLKPHPPKIRPEGAQENPIQIKLVPPKTAIPLKVEKNQTPVDSKPVAKNITQPPEKTRSKPKPKPSTAQEKKSRKLITTLGSHEPYAINRNHCNAIQRKSEIRLCEDTEDITLEAMAKSYEGAFVGKIRSRNKFHELFSEYRRDVATIDKISRDMKFLRELGKASGADRAFISSERERLSREIRLLDAKYDHIDLLKIIDIATHGSRAKAKKALIAFKKAWEERFPGKRLALTEDIQAAEDTSSRITEEDLDADLQNLQQ